MITYPVRFLPPSTIPTVSRPREQWQNPHQNNTVVIFAPGSSSTPFPNSCCKGSDGGGGLFLYWVQWLRGRAGSLDSSWHAPWELVWSWTSYLFVLSLNFLFCNMGLRRADLTSSVVSIKWHSECLGIDVLYMGRNEVRYVYINKPHGHHRIHKYSSSTCDGVCSSCGQDDADVFKDTRVIWGGLSAFKDLI